MDTKDYIKNALKTESTNFDEIGARMQDPRTIRMLHAAIGLTTETGELQDALKKHVFYGRELDTVNMAEEMGDLFWYLAILADSLNVDFEQVMQTNIDKLKKRYGEKFSETAAYERDLKGERQLLEDRL